MKIQYVCHSCIYIDTGDAKIVTDPWFSGAAYHNQWNLFPKPVNANILSDVDHVIISHGHEDHLHSKSLKLLPKTAKVFYPYLWRKGVNKYLHGLGFKDVQEAFSFKTYKLTQDTKVTYIANNLDAIVIIESKGKVLVNLNDALNSHHKNIIRLVVGQIKKRWPKIDYLFCGLGGAGYFPNTVHYEGKKDREIGKLREQFLAHNFCKLIKLLQPDIVLPFTPGFALLAPGQQWINEIKFPRELLDKYYRDNFDADSKIWFVNMYPGDELEENVFNKCSPYHSKLKNNSLSHLIPTEYAEEIKEAKKKKWADEESARRVMENLKKYIPKAAKLLNRETLNDVRFAVCLTDVMKDKYFNIEFKNNHLVIFRSKELLDNRRLMIKTRTDIMDYSYSGPWGGDVLFIGYACDIDVFDESALEENLDIICLRLLTRYPTALGNLRRNPLRGLRYIASNPKISALALKHKILSRGKANKLPFNERSHWLNKSACEICGICDFPLMDQSFGDSLRETEAVEEVPFAKTKLVY